MLTCAPVKIRVQDLISACCGDQSGLENPTQWETNVCDLVATRENFSKSYIISFTSLESNDVAAKWYRKRRKRTECGAVTLDQGLAQETDIVL